MLALGCLADLRRVLPETIQSNLLAPMGINSGSRFLLELGRGQPVNYVLGQTNKLL